MRLLKSKKGVIDQLAPVVIALVSVGVILVVGSLIMAEVGDNAKVKADPNASQAINLTQSAIGDIPSWLSIIVITVIGALLIGLVSIFRRR